MKAQSMQCLGGEDRSTTVLRRQERTAEQHCQGRARYSNSPRKRLLSPAYQAWGCRTRALQLLYLK